MKLIVWLFGPDGSVRGQVFRSVQDAVRRAEEWAEAGSGYSAQIQHLADANPIVAAYWNDGKLRRVTAKLAA